MRPSTLLLLAAGGFAVHLLPQVGELRQTLDALRTARWAWLLVGLALAAASYLAAAVNTAAGVLVHVLGLLVAALLIGRSRVGAAHIPRGWPLLVALAVALAAGGLGAMEAALVAGLTAVGAPAGPAVAGVLDFRLLTFRLPVLPGWLAYRALRADGTI